MKTRAAVFLNNKNEAILFTIVKIKFQDCFYWLAKQLFQSDNPDNISFMLIKI